LELKKYKKLIAVVVAGGLGGAFFAGFLMPFLIKHNVAGFAFFYKHISGIDKVVERIEKETVIVPDSDYFGEALGAIKPSIVAIQSFSGGRVVRHGTGVIMTEDGFVVTLNTIVPSFVSSVQVWANEQPHRAEVVSRDWSNNLALLKIDAGGLGVVSFNEEMPKLADSLLVVGKYVSFNSTGLVIEPALVTRVQSNVFELKTDYNEGVFGGVLINKDAGVLGVVDYKNRTLVTIGQDTLKEFLEGISLSDR